MLSSAPRNHSKIDNHSWSFKRHSYGVASSQGIVSLEGLLLDGSPLAYTYMETGCNTMVSCIKNSSSDFGLGFVVSEYGPVAIWELEGAITNSVPGNAEIYLSVTWYDDTNLTAGDPSVLGWATVVNPEANDRGMIAIANGTPYATLNQNTTLRHLQPAGIRRLSECNRAIHRRQSLFPLHRHRRHRVHRPRNGTTPHGPSASFPTRTPLALRLRARQHPAGQRANAPRATRPQHEPPEENQPCAPSPTPSPSRSTTSSSPSAAPSLALFKASKPPNARSRIAGRPRASASSRSRGVEAALLLLVAVEAARTRLLAAAAAARLYEYPNDGRGGVGGSGGVLRRKWGGDMMPQGRVWAGDSKDDMDGRD